MRKESKPSRRDFLRLGAGGVALASFGSILVKAKPAYALTPSAGQTIVAPNLKAASFDNGATGITIQADGVTIVNPQIRDFTRGVLVQNKPDGTQPKNVRVITDPAAAGYASAGLFHMPSGVRVNACADVEIGDVSSGGTGRMKIYECYRPIVFNGGDNGEVHHTDILGPDYVFPGQGETRGGAIVGIKALYDADSDTSHRMTGMYWHDNKVSGNVLEEILSFDPGNNAGPMGRAADTVGTVDPTNNFITLASSQFVGAGSPYSGWWCVFGTGAARGKYLRISSQSNRRLNLNDPNNVLASVKVGDDVLICAVYDGNRIENNELHCAGVGGNARVGVAFGALVFGSRVANNRVLETPSMNYPDDFGVRTDANGAKVPTGIRVTSRGSLDGMACRAPSAYNSVVGNYVESDVAFTRAYSSDADFRTWNYWANNTLAAGYQLYAPYHDKLPSDPNPPA